MRFQTSRCLNSPARGLFRILSIRDHAEPSESKGGSLACHVSHHCRPRTSWRQRKWRELFGIFDGSVTRTTSIGQNRHHRACTFQTRPMMANVLIKELSNVCRDRLLDEKWVVAPSLRAGHEWLAAVARAGQPVVNGHVKTV